MKKLIVSGCLALTALVILAETADERQARRAKMLERREKVYRHTGGTIAKPGSQQGKIRFVSAVPSVGKAVLEKQYAQFRQYFPFDIETVSGEAVTVETAAATKAKNGYAVAVFIVDAAFTAPMIAAPEEGWAIVNNRVCGTPERTAKEAVKAFAITAGAANSRFGVSFLSTTRPQEFDSVDVIDFPVDIGESIVKQLKLIKVTPQIRAHYRIAVEEGWAPAPTNDVQKAIWDKVHSMPTAPIKIKPETKKIAK